MTLQRDASILFICINVKCIEDQLPTYKTAAYQPLAACQHVRFKIPSVRKFSNVLRVYKSFCIYDTG